MATAVQSSKQNEIYIYAQKTESNYHNKIPSFMELQGVKQQLDDQLPWSPRVTGKAGKSPSRPLTLAGTSERGCIKDTNNKAGRTVRDGCWLDHGRETHGCNRTQACP